MQALSTDEVLDLEPAPAEHATLNAGLDGMQQLVAVANHLDELLQLGDEYQHCQAADRRGE